MQGHLQTAGAENYTPKCDATTGEIVSVYLIHVYIKQKRRKNTTLSNLNTNTKRLFFHALTRIETSKFN